MNSKTTLRFTLAFLLIITTGIAFARSSATKSGDDYHFTLNILRTISPMVENFGDDSLKKEYEKLQKSFQIASENYYSRKFDTSFEQYRSLKKELINMLKKIAEIYLDRTQKILTSTSTESFKIMIKYNKNSGYGSYFKRAYNPLKDVKPYEEENYHLFHDREYVEAYIEKGHRSYEDAKRVFNDPEIQYILNRKSLPSKSLNYIINQYMSVAFLCRQSKQYGIEIHKIKNTHLLGESLEKYGITKDSLNPIFDGRIPDEYKVDAIDNIKLIYAVEMRRLGRAGGGKPADKK